MVLAHLLPLDFELDDFVDSSDNVAVCPVVDRGAIEEIAQHLLAGDSFVIAGYKEHDDFSALKAAASFQNVLRFQGGDVMQYDQLYNETTYVEPTDAINFVKESDGQPKSVIKFKDLAVPEEVMESVKTVVHPDLLPGAPAYDAVSYARYSQSAWLAEVSPGASFNAIGLEFLSRTYKLIANSAAVSHKHRANCRSSAVARSVVMIDSSNHTETFRYNCQRKHKVEPVDRLHLLSPIEFAEFCDTVDVHEQVEGELLVIGPGRFYCAYDRCGCNVSIYWGQVPTNILIDRAFMDEALFQRVSRCQDIASKSLTIDMLTAMASKTNNLTDNDALVLFGLVQNTDRIMVESIGEGWENWVETIVGKDGDEDGETDEVEDIVGSDSLLWKCDFCASYAPLSYFICVGPCAQKAAAAGHCDADDDMMYCAYCVVEGRGCKCKNLEPRRAQAFEPVVASRNQAVARLRVWSTTPGRDVNADMKRLIDRGDITMSEYLGAEGADEFGDDIRVTNACIRLLEHRKQVIRKPVQCCFEDDCLSHEHRISVTSHSALQVEPSLYICYLDLAVSGKVHASQIPLDYVGDSEKHKDNMQRVSDWIDNPATHLAMQLPLRFSYVSEAPTRCAPQANLASKVGFYDILSENVPSFAQVEPIDLEEEAANTKKRPRSSGAAPPPKKAKASGSGAASSSKTATFSKTSTASKTSTTSKTASGSKTKSVGTSSNKGKGK